MKILWSLLLLTTGLLLTGKDVIHEDFATSKPGMKLPEGWSKYGARDAENFTEVISLNGKNALRIVDLSQKETGIRRDFPAQPGKFYRGTVKLSRLGGKIPQDVIRLQVQFIRSSGKNTFIGGAVKTDGETSFAGQAPENTTGIRIYIYTSFNAQMDVALHSFKLEVMDSAPEAPPKTEKTDNCLIFEDFASSKPGMKLPAGWSKYGARDAENFTEVISLNGKNALRIVDLSQRETGIRRDFPAQPGKFYRGTVKLSQLGDTIPQEVIRLQVQFVRSKGKNTFIGGVVKTDGETSFAGQAPENTTGIRVYVYTSFNAQMDVALHSFKLEELKEAPPVDGNPKQGFVPPVPRLKDLCRTTPLDQVTILADKRYSKDAARIADALAKVTGKRPAILPDTARAAGHKILLGNRDTNQQIEYLYRRYFAYTDIVYPGKGGYELRTVHNPFGNKENYVIAGGSDDAGVSAAADRLIAKAGKTLPPTIDVQTALPLPRDIASSEYETRMGSGFVGYGWNTLSWLLENYYRSGDAKFAREFIRLGLHTKPSDMPTLKKVNAESFWDFSQPLSTPYHYMGHYIVLLWDLVEEMDVFTDEERLAVTRALAKQIKHPDINMCYNPDIDNAKPADYVGDRHAQWSTMMMYVLARYMDRDYPHPVWKKVIKCAEHFHEPIFRSGTWAGASTVFSWFASSMLNEPAQYLVMTGKTLAHPEGMLMNAAKVYEIMWDPGRKADASGTMSAHNHRLLALLTGDGKYHYYADELSIDSSTQKLGQSMRTAKAKARIPSENIGRWLIAPMPEAACIRTQQERPFTGLTLNSGYRDTLDTSGDRVMFDLCNELGRKPYQLNTLYTLRINGNPYLEGYENYAQVLKNGTAGQHVPRMGRLRKADTAGNIVYHVSAVPDMAHAVWERTLMLKKRKAALIADRVTAKDNGPLQIVLNWELPMFNTPTVRDGNRITFMNNSSVAASQMELSADGPITPSGNARIAALAKAGDSFRAAFTLPKPFKGDIQVRLVTAADGPSAVDVALDGKVMQKNIALDTPIPATAKPVNLADLDLPAGEHTLSIIVTNPGNSRCSVQLWRVNFAAKGAESSIAGAGMEAGIKFHKGAVDHLQKGESHTFFTVCGLAAKAERIADHANAAILYIPEKTVAFSGEYQPFGKGRLVWVDEKETAVMDDNYQVTVSPTSPEAALKLRQLQGPPFAAVRTKDVPAGKADYACESTIRFSHAVPVMFKGKPAVFAGGRNSAAVISPEGKMLLKIELPGRLLSLHGTGKLLLVGTKEDKLFAFDENGKLLWTHISLCATPFEKQKHYYWYKGAAPGVYDVSSMKDEIYTAGACTVERISGDGKVINRYEQFWGTQSKLLPLIRKDGSMRMLSARLWAGHDATIYAVDPVRNKTFPMFFGTKTGFRDFPGFSSQIRSQMILCDLNGDGSQELIGATAGMYSWIQVFDDNGKILHQVNLGGKPRLTDLAAAKDLVVSVDPWRRLMIFDGKLNIQYLQDLPAEPKQVLATDRRIMVMDNSGVTVYDREGIALKRLQVPAAQKMVLLPDGALCVISSSGKVFFCGKDF